MIRSVAKHFQCGIDQERSLEAGMKQPRERKSIFRSLRSFRNKASTEKKKVMEIDELEVEWSNSPKSRLRRNGFDIPVFG